MILSFEQIMHCGAGYCSYCKEYDECANVEPDAFGYHCEQCDTKSLMGAEQALIEGLVICED